MLGVVLRSVYSSKVLNWDKLCVPKHLGGKTLKLLIKLGGFFKISPLCLEVFFKENTSLMVISSLPS